MCIRDRLCTRLLPRTEEMGSEELRLLSAITPKGEVFYQGTVLSLIHISLRLRATDNYCCQLIFLEEL